MVTAKDFDRFIFVVGAPRCGTTTLSRFLKNHPDVRFPLVKEPHFFSQNDLRGLSDDELRARVERDYLQRFFRDEAGPAIAADCSVTYLYNPELLEPVLRLWPKSRFIIALRDPLTMLPSMHQRLVFMGDETLPSFKKAWAAIPDRASGRRIPRRCVEPRWLRYDEAARFGTYVGRLFDVVGRERCHPVIFDDLSGEPEREYRKLMKFCGLVPVPATDFTPERSGKGVRLHWLQRLLKRPPAVVRNFIATDSFLHVTGVHDAAETNSNPGKNGRSKILGLRKRILQWNRTTPPVEQLPSELQWELHDHLEGEIAELQRLIGRDLSHWLRPGAPRQSPKSRGSGSKAAILALFATIPSALADALSKLDGSLT